MRYPVDVYTGKIQAYPEGKPSAIAKIQVDGELMLTELGLEGDEQAEKKVHGGPDRALCHYPREHYLYWAREFPEQAELFVAPAFGENLSMKRRTKNAKTFHDKCENFTFRASNETAALTAVFLFIKWDHFGYG